MSSIPLDHDELQAAVENGVFPAERYWIDFKAGLYPHRPGAPPTSPTRGQRESAHLELARDAASMAIRGGYLIYGIHEDRSSFRFHPVGMGLEHGIRETVTQVVSSRTSPGLHVLTHVLEDPEQPGTGFLVVEVPESPEAPHMTEGVFHGRSDTGRTTLDEPEVERLILQRHRLHDRLAGQMAITAEHDPGPGHRGHAPQVYLTAVPTRGHRDLMLPFTTLAAARGRLWPLCNEVMNGTRQRRLSHGELHGELEGLDFVRRGGRIAGIWHRTWDETHEPRLAAYRALGISDDGEIRFLRFQAGKPLTPDEAASLVLNAPDRPAGAIAGIMWESDLLRHVHAFTAMVAVLAREVQYSGSWLMGLEIRGVANYISERHRLSLNTDLGHRIQILDNDHYRQTTRTTTADLRDGPFRTTAVLTRPLLRDLDRENLLTTG